MSSRAVKNKTVVTETDTMGETSPIQGEPNAESLEALADLKAGKLTRYVDEDDMFKKLGIKVGKTQG